MLINNTKTPTQKNSEINPRDFRVMHIITRLILGGAQENTLLSVLGLRERGWQAELVTGPALGPEGELIERAKSEKVNLTILPEMRREINPWRDALSLFKLYRLMLERRPHIVHTHSSKAGILGRAAACLAGVPVVVHSIHGLPFHPYEKWHLNTLYKALECFCGGLTDLIISVAGVMSEAAREAGVSCAYGFRTIYSGMEIGPFLSARERRAETRQRLGIAESESVVGIVARLFHLKGHEDLIAAAPDIVREISQVKFLFVGNGILKEELQEQARRLGVLERIIFTGLVPPDQIPDLMGAMDVLAHPSLREGLPRTVPQALLAETPPVACNLDGAPEIIEDGVTGLLVPPRDPAALARAVIRLLKNPEEARKMALAGKDKCRVLFDAGIMSDKIGEEYIKLLRKKGVTAHGYSD